MNSENSSFERSYKKLEHYANNVIISDYTSFNPNLKIFINLLENDDFFYPITEKLILPNIVDNWWVYALSSRSSMIGSGKLILPDDEDERLALFYQLCVRIISGEINLTNMSMTFFAETNYNQMVSKFNTTFFVPFLQLLEYKIEDIKEKMISDNAPLEPSPEYIRIVNYTIKVGENKGIISTGDNTNNTINNYNELYQRLSELKKLEDVKDNPEAEELVEDIVKLTKENKNKDKISIVQKIGELIKISPSTEAKLKEIVSNFAIGIGSNVTVEAIKYLLG